MSVKEMLFLLIAGCAAAVVTWVFHQGGGSGRCLLTIFLGGGLLAFGDATEMQLSPIKKPTRTINPQRGVIVGLLAAIPMHYDIGRFL